MFRFLNEAWRETLTQQLTSFSCSWKKQERRPPHTCKNPDPKIWDSVFSTVSQTLDEMTNKLEKKHRKRERKKERNRTRLWNQSTTFTLGCERRSWLSTFFQVCVYDKDLLDGIHAPLPVQALADDEGQQVAALVFAVADGTHGELPQAAVLQTPAEDEHEARGNERLPQLNMC